LIAGLLFLALAGASPAGAAPPDAAAALDLAVARAQSSLQSGDLTAAQGHYRQALFEGWMVVATLESRAGRRTETLAALESAAAAADDAEAKRALAVAWLRGGEATRARELLVALVASDPKDAETRRLLARAWAAEGQTANGVKVLDEARAGVASDPQAAFLLGTEYLWLKRPELAGPLFAQALAAQPVPPLHVLIGRAYRDAGEYALARTHFRAALRLDPRVRHAHYYLGMVALADAAVGDDRLQLAIGEFREELLLAPADPAANDQLGVALLDAGRPQESLAPLQSAVDADPRFLSLSHLGRAQLALDRPGEAAESLRRALALAEEQGASAGDLRKIHYQLGLALRKMGDGAGAARALAEARQASADDGAEGITTALPSAGTGAGDAGESSPLLSLSAARRTETERHVKQELARTYFNLGVIDVQGQRFAEAAAQLEKAAALDPEFPQVQASLGIAYFNGRRFEQATGPLARAAAARPQDRGLARMLAMAWLNTGAYGKAADVLADDPERESDPTLQMAYGLALVKSERAAEAEAVLSRLLRRHGDSAELSVLLAEAQAQQGRLDAALESVRRALSLQPDVAEGQALLDKIQREQRQRKEKD
jgi:tetratricopeptide (TPR) repeat protein